MNNDTVVIDAQKWHWICHDLLLDSYKDIDNRKDAFEDYFNCTTKWKSRLDEWPGEDVSEKPNPVMLLTFEDPKEASLFVLKFL
jgi:hypothetical protein